MRSRCYHVKMLHKSLSVQVSTQVLRCSSNTGCYKRLAVIDRFLSLVNSCGSRTVKAPLIHGNKESGGLNNLTLSFQLSWEWSQGLLNLCLVLGMLVSFLLINLIQFAGVDTSILYLFCLIWKTFDLKCGTWLVCTELGWFEWAYVGPLLNVSATTMRSRRTSSLYDWLIRCIKCLFKKTKQKTNHKQKQRNPKLLPLLSVVFSCLPLCWPIC